MPLRNFASLREEKTKAQFRLVALLLAPMVLALAGLAIVRLQTGIPLAVFMEDPAAVTEAPFYVGFFSNIGILLWCAAAAICFFCSAILYRGQAEKTQQAFFFCSGLMISVLMLDDFFMLHETVMPDYFGIPQNVIQGSYGLMVLLYLREFRKLLFDAEHLILFIAFGFLGFSMFCDVVPFRVPAHLLFEEGSKLLGIASFLIYFSKEGVRHLDLLIFSARTSEISLSESIETPAYNHNPQTYTRISNSSVIASIS